MKPIGMAVIGAGYWGPNLVRNILRRDDATLRWVCDLDINQAAKAVGRQSTVPITDDLDIVLDDPNVAAVAIATPAHTHTSVALACIDAGKHVLVEKPLATSVDEGRKLVDAARDAGVVLMCDHTYCYTPTVQRIHQLVRGGELGEIQYVDSVRINLGLVQSDIDVFWDLAPHDLSILDFVLADDARPVSVAAHGADPIGAGHSCVGYLTLPLANGGIAHAHVNWLSPTKVRTMHVGGSRRMLVWDDMHPAQRLSVHDRGVDLEGPMNLEARRDTLISYRVGDMIAPALGETEALQNVIAELVGAIRERRPAATGGESGLWVLEVLEAIDRSIDRGGAMVPLPVRDRAQETL
ncbi:MAG: Gfo/Idh/MocA family protein [Acidimicrobiales bacterium]